MAEDATKQPLDPRLVETVLLLLDQGHAHDAMSLSRAADAPLADVQAVLAAVSNYGDHVAAERHRASTGPGDELLPAGTRVGAFVVEAVLGSGAMGVVYRAHQENLGNRPVALKVLPPALASRDPRYGARFRREAELASKIHHPNLAEVYGYEAAGELVCFAMRLVEGCTLQAVLRQRAAQSSARLRPTSAAYVRQCVVLARQLADALHEVHTHHLVHRDVKPANVILEGAAAADEAALAHRPVLIDFGLLRPTGDSELTGSHTLLGTPAYASPESKLGRPLGPQADVFSLAATLHDLLATTAPGARDSATAGLQDIRTINRAVDAGLAAILGMALQERPELRYENGSAIREELDRWLAGEELRALPASALGRWRLRLRRDPARAVRVAAIATLVAVAIAGITLALAEVWHLTALARRGAQHLSEGALLEANAAFRELSASQVAGVLPWLADDLYLATAHWGDTGLMRDAVTHLNTANVALTAARHEAAQREFALAHTRLMALLFSKHEPSPGDAIRAMLMRELRDGKPGFRQGLAAGTFANYLVVQPGRQAIPDELIDLLADRARPSSGADLTTRRAATSALGTIRLAHAHHRLIERMNDEDLEVARLAIQGSHEVFQWLHSFDRVLGRSADRAWMQAWADALAVAGGNENTRDLACHGADHLAWWEQDPEDPGRQQPRLELVPWLRKQVEATKTEFATVWRAAGDRIGSGSVPGIHPGILDRYQSTSGRFVNNFDAGIWQDEDDTPTTIPIPSHDGTHQGAEDHPARLAWARRDDASVPTLSGPVLEARWVHAIPRLWESEEERHIGYLELRRPGRSRVHLRTSAPTAPHDLAITLEHMLGGRPVLPFRGMVHFRLSVVGTDWRIESPAPNGGANRYETHTVPAHLLAGRREVEVAFEYLHGNTTHRINSIELTWTPRR